MRHRTAGAYSLASHLRKRGLIVQVIEGWSLLTLENLDAVKSLIDKFVSPETLFIGFSTTFFSNSYKIAHRRLPAIWHRTTKNSLFLDDAQIIELRAYIKAINPKIDIVIGGSQAKSSDDNFSDYKIIGYAEKEIEDYLTFKAGKNPFFMPIISGTQRIIQHNPKADGFDFSSSSITWEQRDAVFPGEVLPIEVSRGCIFKCKFCAFPLNGKSKVDYLKQQDVLYSELMHNYESFGTTRYVFSDDTFNDSTVKLEYLLETFNRLPFKMSFSSYARLDLITAHPEQIELLKALGAVSIFFGIESMNQQSVSAIGKGGKIERLVETLYKCKESWGDDIFVLSGFILGLPHDTYETMERWLTRLIDWKFPLHGIGLNALSIQPNPDETDNLSEFDRNPEKFGYIVNGYNWSNTSTNTTSEGCRQLQNEAGNYMRDVGRTMDLGFGVPTLNSLGLSNQDLIRHRSFIDLKKVRYQMHNNYKTYLNTIVNL